jgi:hypothetical protein
MVYNGKIHVPKQGDLTIKRLGPGYYLYSIAIMNNTRLKLKVKWIVWRVPSKWDFRIDFKRTKSDTTLS